MLEGASHPILPSDIEDIPRVEIAPYNRHYSQTESYYDILMMPYFFYP